MAQVVEVLQTPNRFLIFNQSLEPDHGEGEFSPPDGNGLLNPALPGFVKRHAGERIDEIDSIRVGPELDDDPLFQKIVNAADERNFPSPKFLQGFEKTRSVFAGSLKEEIEIRGKSGVSVINNRHTADEDISNFVDGQKADEFFCVLGEGNGGHIFL